MVYTYNTYGVYMVYVFRMLCTVYGVLNNNGYKRNIIQGRCILW